MCVCVRTRVCVCLEGVLTYWFDWFFNRMIKERDERGKKSNLFFILLRVFIWADVNQSDDWLMSNIRPFVSPFLKKKKKERVGWLKTRKKWSAEFSIILFFLNEHTDEAGLKVLACECKVFNSADLVKTFQNKIMSVLERFALTLFCSEDDGRFWLNRGKAEIFFKSRSIFFFYVYILRNISPLVTYFYFL